MDHPLSKYLHWTFDDELTIRPLIIFLLGLGVTLVFLSDMTNDSSIRISLLYLVLTTYICCAFAWAIEGILRSGLKG